MSSNWDCLGSLHLSEFAGGKNHVRNMNYNKNRKIEGKKFDNVQ